MIGLLISRTGLAVLVLLPIALHAAPCQYIDLMPEYFAFEQQSSKMTPAERADAFTRDIALRHPDYYVAEDYGDEDMIRKAALRFFNPATVVKVPDVRPLMQWKLREASREIVPALRIVERRYTRRFPDFGCNAVISFGISLSRFDAYAFTGRDGRDYVRFGLDMIARMHQTSNLPEMISHVLFQVYFSQLYPELKAEDYNVTWQSTWVDGMGSYATLRLGQPTDEQQVLGYPRDLIAQMSKPGMMAKTAHAMLAAFDKGGDANYAQWFGLGGKSSGLPFRAAAYMGLRMVQEQARTHSLAQLAHIPPAEQKKLVRSFLERQASTT